MTDVLVLGAGLAGLCAARDLGDGGADVVVLEARRRVGGRVEQVPSAAGRPVQLGGEVVGPVHTAYLGVVEELGLTLEPSYTDARGTTTFDLFEGVERSEHFPVRETREREDYERVEREWGKLVASVNPADPWSHPDAARLDGASIGAWLRSVGALPATVRRLEIGALALADGSIEQSSLLAELRKSAAVGEHEFYSYERWESLQVAEGSAQVAERLAAELGERIRLGSEVTGVVVDGGCRVRLASGEELRAEAVVCALPAPVAARLPIEGVDPERIRSLRAQRHALAAKVVAVYSRSVWADTGSNGLAEGEHLLSSTWPQREGVLSALVPPERLAYLLALTDDDRDDVVRDELERLYGSSAREPEAIHYRLWGTDPFTRGYVTHWWPGDVMRVGPRHGTHAPPFYVCGSDQWVAGYMEGAVRSGRSAASVVLSGSGP
ncbi:MAG TPA: NAD(P)/FAD-dependent oxidoreductase [Gaiellaceae bacterium]